jgi:hypothetical protein
MAFCIDCERKHGLISIQHKPASYGGAEWRCKACKRCIPDNHIGVLNCERCQCDICPDCWTVLLPKIVNAAGYPCFWRDERPPHASPGSSVRMLGCHRRQDANKLCGIDQIQRSGCFAVVTQTVQCYECRIKQSELAPAPVGGAHPAVPFLPFGQPAGGAAPAGSVFGQPARGLFPASSSAGIVLGSSGFGFFGGPAPASSSQSGGTPAAAPAVGLLHRGLSSGVPDVPGSGFP